MTTIRATIERLRELHAKATPGEWEMNPLLSDDDFGGLVTAEDPNTAVVEANLRDMAFILEAHNAMPALLEYIERLERVAEAVKAWIPEPLPSASPLTRERAVIEALDELDALDSEAFDRRNFTYSND